MRIRLTFIIKLLSIPLGAYLIYKTNSQLGSSALSMPIFVVALSFALIFFGKQLGSIRDTRHFSLAEFNSIDAKSPSSIVGFMGWVFLIGYFFLLIALK